MNSHLDVRLVLLILKDRSEIGITEVVEMDINRKDSWLQSKLDKNLQQSIPE